MLVRSRIINVKRKPTKCPICGERVVDIIYGTGIMTEIDFALEYRKEGIMGGDNIPRRPPIWACVCGCLRFRKVNPDGTDASVKVKLLKNTRKAPASVFTWESEMVKRVLQTGGVKTIYHYKVTVTTELGENEILSVAALSGDDALNEAERIISLGPLDLRAESVLQWKCLTINNLVPL